MKIERRTRGTRAGKFQLAALVVACSACFADASAATWRCGNTYSDRPCEGGAPVKVDDPRSDADRRAAEAGAQSNARQADQMERARLSQEKAAHERDRQAAREARSAALAERRMALSEQQARERAARAASDPRKSTTSFSSGLTGDAPAKEKKRKSRGSDAG